MTASMNDLTAETVRDLVLRIGDDLDPAGCDLADAVLAIVDARWRDDPAAVGEREGFVRSVGMRVAAGGGALEACLASVRGAGRRIWPHLARVLDERDLGDGGMLLWEVVDRVSQLVADGHRDAVAAAPDLHEQRRAELVDGLLGSHGEDPHFAGSAVRELGLGPAPYVVVRIEEGDPIDLGRTCRAASWLCRGERSVGLLTVAADRLGDLVGRLAEHASRPTGMSGVVVEPHRIAQAHRQAELALRIRAGDPGLTVFDQVLPEAVLQSDPAVTHYLVSSWLGPVLDLPEPEREDLLRTLEAWVESGSSPSGASALLYCHRNTVLNRMKRITTLLGRDLSGPVPLELALALRAVRRTR